MYRFVTDAILCSFTPRSPYYFPTLFFRRSVQRFGDKGASEVCTHTVLSDKVLTQPTLLMCHLSKTAVMASTG